MKGLLIFDILNYLYEMDVVNETQADITDFINQIKKNRGDRIEQHNVNRINKAIGLIRARNYANIFFAKDNVFTPALEIDTDRVQASLLLAGYDYVVDERRKKESDELNKNIKDNTTVQKISAIIMLVFTAALVATAIINVDVLVTKPPPSPLQLSPQTEQLLDNMLKSQMKIDSFLRSKPNPLPPGR